MKKFLFMVIATLLLWTGSAVAETPQYGGTLRMVNLGAGINAIAWDIEAWIWKHGHDTGLMMEHLFMGDLQKGPRGTNEYNFQASAWIPPRVRRGELVERLEISKNPLELRFHLRKGVYWQARKGVMKKREFVASDVVHSMNRLKNGKRAIPTYVDWADWEARGKYLAVAKLKKWNANWYYRFGWGYYDGIQAPEQEKAKGGANKWKNLTGTGPYALQKYRKGHSYTWVRNKHYWDSTPIDGKDYKLPFANKVIYMIMKDRQARNSALKTGKIDMHMVVDTRDVKSMKKSNPELKWSRYPSTGGFMVSMRMDTKPFDDIRVRRALNLAVNQQEIIDTLMEGQGILVNYPFPPAFKSVFTPYAQLPKSAQELFTYNPEKAKKMLAEAGFPNGFTFKAQISNSSQLGLDIGAMVVNYLAKVGVTLELVPMDYPSYMSMMFRKKMGPGYFFSNDHGNPFATIRKNFVTKQTWNPYMFADSYLDKTYYDTVENPNLSDDEGFEVMKGLAVYAMDKAPAIWLPGGYGHVAVWPWVKNYHGEIRVGAWRPAGIFSRIWIDQKLKRKMGY